MTGMRRPKPTSRKRQRRKPSLTVLSPAGKPRQLRRPSGAELRQLLLDLMPYAGELPPALWDRLRDLLVALIAEEQIDMRSVDRMRWQAVCEEMTRVGYEGSFAAAAEKLRHSPYAGGEDAIRKSYERIQRALPSEQRRPRSYRRRTTGA
jgi:hypothetical protein